MLMKVTVTVTITADYQRANGVKTLAKEIYRLAVSKTWLPKWAKMPHMQRKIAITRGSFFNNECNVPWQEEYFLEPE
jgi:hypothetical protein